MVIWEFSTNSEFTYIPHINSPVYFVISQHLIHRHPFLCICHCAALISLEKNHHKSINLNLESYWDKIPTFVTLWVLQTKTGFVSFCYFGSIQTEQVVGSEHLHAVIMPADTYTEFEQQSSNAALWIEKYPASKQKLSTKVSKPWRGKKNPKTQLVCIFKKLLLPI